jgi:Ca2+-binding EF-hand superfamily protein
MTISLTTLNRVLLFLFVVPAGACMLSAAAAEPAKSTSLQSQAGETLPMETVRATRFELMDLNGDGYLQPDEVDPNDTTLLSQFRVLDEDGDGQLSEAEFALFSAAN